MISLNHILDGSMFSNERLMQAREHYAPTDSPVLPELAFARWTQRVAVQAELASAREIAGLSDDELSAMEAVFVHAPLRPRSAWVRLTVASGVAFALAGGLSVLVSALSGGSESGAYPMAQVLGTMGALVGLMMASVGALCGFGTLHLELAHGTTGLYFGRLDEQHPWLLKTMSLTHNPAAEAYRQRVLRERGWLRGVDFVMMSELVRAQHAVEHAQPTRAVAEQIQLLPATARSKRRPPQPRLVHVTASNEFETKLTRLKQLGTS